MITSQLHLPPAIWIRLVNETHLNGRYMCHWHFWTNACLNFKQIVGSGDSEMLFLLVLSFAASSVSSEEPSPFYYEPYQVPPNLEFEYNLQPNLPGFEEAAPKRPTPKKKYTSWSSWTKCSKGISGSFQTRMRNGNCPNIKVLKCTLDVPFEKPNTFPFQDVLQTWTTAKDV